MLYLQYGLSSLTEHYLPQYAISKSNDIPLYYNISSPLAYIVPYGITHCQTMNNPNIYIS